VNEGKEVPSVRGEEIEVRPFFQFFCLRCFPFFAVIFNLMARHMQEHTIPVARQCIKRQRRAHLFSIAKQLNAATSLNNDVRTRAVLAVGVYFSNFA
jgi:hypothetical protein